MKLQRETSSNSLIGDLYEAKKLLIKKKLILDKKDNHVYPILDVPFDIPNNWNWVYLSDISIIQEGPGIRKNQYRDSGMQFLTVTNILEGSIDFEKSLKYISLDEYNKKYKHFTIDEGDIVTACSGASWGKSAMFLSNRKMMLNTSTLRLRFFNDLGENKYLYYLTKSGYFKSNLSSHSTGQQANYGYSHYSKIPIPIPSRLEQKRIVKKLDKAFEAIDQAKANLEKNIENAKELFQSKLNEVFSQKGDGWEEKTLGELCDKTDNIKWKEHPNKVFQYVDLSSVSRDTLSVTGTQDVNIKNAPSRAKKLIHHGDVIFATTRPTLRRATIIDDELSGQICSTGYVVLKPKENISSDWIFLFLLTSKFMDRMEALQRGASYPAVTDNDVKGSKLSVPLSKNIETNLVLEINKFQKYSNNLINIYLEKLKVIEELKKSTLQKAFAGEL